MLLKTLQFAGRLLLRMILFGTILLGSCGGLSLTYSKSPYLTLKPIEPEVAAVTSRFFVAFVYTGDNGKRLLDVRSYKQIEQINQYREVSFILPRDVSRSAIALGEAYARIAKTDGPDNSETVQVYVRGETPWLSLSEYRVKNNAVTPLRFATGTSWLLAAFMIMPLLLVWLLRKPVNRFARFATRSRTPATPGHAHPPKAGPV